MTGQRLISAQTTSPGIDVDLSRTIASIRAAMREGGHQAALSIDVRSRLQQRQAVLRACSENATCDEIEVEIAKHMTAYPSSRAAALTDIQVTVRQYANALEGVPLWALREVIGNISRGSVPGLNPDFMPTAPRIRQLVDERTERSDLEAREIRTLLDAPVVGADNPEMAAAVQKVIGEGLRGCAEMMRAKDRQFAGPAAPTKPPFKPMSIAELTEYYKTAPLAGRPVRNVTRNDDRNVSDDVERADAGMADYERRVGP